MKDVCGIYCITNLINNKVYIGQSKHIKIRWKDHKSELRNNKHGNQHLQFAWNKYGEDNFEFSIIKTCSIDQLNDLEMFYINDYKAYDCNFGYNLRFDEDDKLKFTDDVLMKMREVHSYEYVPILQIDLNGNIVNKFSSVSDAARSIDTSPSGILNCANRIHGIGLSKTLKNFIWIRENDYEFFKTINIDEYLENDCSLSVNQYSYPSGKYIKTYKTVTDAAIENNISNDVVSLCVRKVQMQSNGYTYRRTDDIDGFNDIEINIKPKNHFKNMKSIIAYNLDMTVFKQYECGFDCKDDGFNPSHVAECCKGKRKTHGGYIWKYSDEFDKYIESEERHAEN